MYLLIYLMTFNYNFLIISNIISAVDVQPKKIHHKFCKMNIIYNLSNQSFDFVEEIESGRLARDYIITHILIEHSYDISVY